MNIIGCLDGFESGRLAVGGRDVTNHSVETLSDFRNRHIGFIFQLHNLLNIEVPMHGQGPSPQQRRQRARELLEMIGLGQRGSALPSQLSGGQRQPTGNLDSKTGLDIVNLLRALNEKEGVTVVCSTHDPKMLSSSDRVCWIRDGRLEKISSRQEFRLEDMEGDALGR